MSPLRGMNLAYRSTCSRTFAKVNPSPTKGTTDVRLNHPSVAHGRTRTGSERCQGPAARCRLPCRESKRATWGAHPFPFASLKPPAHIIDKADQTTLLIELAMSAPRPSRSPASRGSTCNNPVHAAGSSPSAHAVEPPRTRLAAADACCKRVAGINHSCPRRCEHYSILAATGQSPICRACGGTCRASLMVFMSSTWRGGGTNGWLIWMQVNTFILSDLDTLWTFGSLDLWTLRVEPSLAFSFTTSMCLDGAGRSWNAVRRPFRHTIALLSSLRFQRAPP